MTALRDAIDYTTLGWVKPELDETLRQARIEIEGFAEDPSDGSRMRFCASYLHQVQGTLRMVELYAPAMVAEEMEQLAQALQGDGTPDRDIACATLMRGVVLLPDYLERLQSGHKDIPIVLLPLLNELRAARGEAGLSESVLFAPDLAKPLPPTLRQSEDRAAPRNTETMPLVERLSAAVAAWPDTGAPADAGELVSAAEALLALSRQEETRRMLWVATAVATALRDGALPPSASLRQAFGSVQREARRQFEDDGFGIPRPETALEPTRQLLYHVAHSDAAHPALDELRSTFDLVAQLPTESEISHAQGSLSGRNRALLDTVSAAVKEDLLRVKDVLDLHLRAENASAADLQPQVESLGRVADTLGMLGLGVARNVVQQQRDAMQAIVRGERSADEGALLDVAGALLYVDATLDDQVARLGDTDTGGDQDDLFSSESRKLLETIAREAIANFADARQAFVAFVETSWDHAELAEVPRLLEEVAGALSMLEFPLPASYLAGVRMYVENELIGRRRVPNGRQLDTFADALASLEYYLEALRENRFNRDDILDIARNSLETLGYWPLPESLATPVDAVAAASTDAAPAAMALHDDVDVDAAVRSLIDRADQGADAAKSMPAASTADTAVSMPASDAVQERPAIAVGTAPGGFETTGDEIDDEIREIFLEEFGEEIDNLDTQLPAWRENPADVERLRTIRRVFHTLKGSGRLVGARALGEFSWKVENMLNRVLDGTRPASPAVVAMVDNAFFTLPQLLAALRGDGAVTADLGALQALADRVAEGEEAFASPAATSTSSLAVEAAMPGIAEPPAAATVDALDPPTETLPASVDALLLEILDVEVAGHLATVDAWLAQAHGAPTHATDALLRATHTMNGAFAMTEVPAINTVLGPAETYLRRLFAARQPASAEGVAAIGGLADLVRTSMITLHAVSPHVPTCALLAAQLVALRDSLPESAAPRAMLGADDDLGHATSIPHDPEAGVELTDTDLSAYAGFREDAQSVEAARGDAAPPVPDAEPASETVYVDAESAPLEAAAGAAIDASMPSHLADSAIPDDPAAFADSDAAEAVASSAGTTDAATDIVQPDTAPPAEIPDVETTLAASDTGAELADASDAGAGDTSPAALTTGDFLAQVAALHAQRAQEDDAQLATLHEAQSRIDAGHLDTIRREAEARALAERADAMPMAGHESDAETTAPFADGVAMPGDGALAEHAEAVPESLVKTGTTSVSDDAGDAAALESASPMSTEHAIASSTDDAPATAEAEETPAASLAPSAVDAGGDAVASAEAIEAERLDAERAEAERIAAEEELEYARLEAEYAEADRIAREEKQAQERIEAERVEAERAEAERAEAERIEAERIEAERVEAERVEAERAETERVEAERVEAERAEAERAEAERAEAERAEAERVENERLTEEATAAAAATPDTADAAAAPALDDPAVDTAIATPPASAASASEDPDEALDLTGLDPELVDIFVEEAGDLLDHSDGLLAKLRDAPTEREPLVGLQRDLHTIKGGARMAGVMAVGELGHAMESLLESVVELRSELGRDGVPLLERGFDRLHAMITRVIARRAIGVPEALIAEFDERAAGRRPGERRDAAVETAPVRLPAPKVKPSVELKPLSAPIDQNATAADEDDIGVRAPQEQVRIRADLLDRLVTYAGEVAIYRARLEQQLGAFRTAMGEMGQTNMRLRDQLRRLDIETEAQIIARYQREGDHNDATFDPLELDRFSTLQQLSRALGESAADLSSLEGTLDDLTRQYETLLLQQSRVSSDLQEGLMRTRMVPFDALVPRLRRVVRQASGDTGKQVQLKLDGAQGELDRNVLERMTAPLEHMLRNAVAHGLESPEQRRKAKKPEEGVVRIAVRREGSEVVLEVADDGRGLDRPAIRRRGEERGLVRADAVLVDGDLDSLIFEPGFSTADAVSRLAGRGVGMDVVASEVRQLGGTLDIRSRDGEGTTFTLRLPQTLAVTQAVFVRIGETQFAVPIASVRGAARLARDVFDTVGASYAYGGEDYPVHDLGGLVGHGAAKADGQLQVPVLLIRSGDLRAAVAVDQIVGNREIVVKPVGPQVASIPGIFGATVMGDGSVVVILDVAPLVRRQIAQPRDVAADEPVLARNVPLVMVVDDSVTMRKVTGRVLERHNFEVASARDGIDALERMVERVPDLMLLDIEMPRMDGYELATQMKADPRLRDVPIVMITSRTGEKHRQRAFEIGVERYLGKPYQENELIRNVYELLKLELRHDG